MSIAELYHTASQKKTALPPWKYALLCATWVLIASVLAACTGPILLPAGTPAPAKPTPVPAYTGVEPAWRIPLGAEINWAPTLLTVGDRSLLIVASEAGSVLALDPESGGEVWRFESPGQLWTDSVTVLDDAVFVSVEGAQIFLLDGLTGTTRWQASMQPPASAPLAGLEARGKPALGDGILYIPTAGVGSRASVINPQIDAPLVAVDFESGAEEWRLNSGDYILRGTHVDVESGRLLVGGNYLPETDIDEGGAMRIHALDLAEGQPVWTYESLDGLVKSVWADNDIVTYVAYRDFLVGLDAHSGEERYRHNTGNWVQSFALFELPTLNDGDPALVYGSANAFLNAVDPADGAFLWRHNIDGAFNYPIGNAVLAGDTLFFITQRGDIQALNAADGSLRWQQATGLETRDGIAVADGHIFVGSVDGSVYGYRLR